MYEHGFENKQAWVLISLGDSQLGDPRQVASPLHPRMPSGVEGQLRARVWQGRAPVRKQAKGPARGLPNRGHWFAS